MTFKWSFWLCLCNIVHSEFAQFFKNNWEVFLIIDCFSDLKLLGQKNRRGPLNFIHFALLRTFIIWFWTIFGLRQPWRIKWKLRLNHIILPLYLFIHLLVMFQCCRCYRGLKAVYPLDLFTYFFILSFRWFVFDLFCFSMTGVAKESFDLFE